MKAFIELRLAPVLKTSAFLRVVMASGEPETRLVSQKCIFVHCVHSVAWCRSLQQLPGDVYPDAAKRLIEPRKVLLVFFF